MPPTKDMAVVAQLEITTNDGHSEIVRSFDLAWHRMLELAPASSRFIGFVRKDS